MTSRDRDMGRKYLSGAEKARRKREASEQQQKLLQKIPKLTTFFSTTSPSLSRKVSLLNMSTLTEYQHKEEVKEMAVGQNKFTRDLYQALSKGKDGNFFFSPFSISAALAMVYMGSKGNTESQMESVLHFPFDKTSIKKAFHDLVKEYKKQHEEFELKTSNMVYISDKLTVQEEFIHSLTKDFLASSKLVDFNKSESVRKEINATVEKETNSKIKDLIAKGILDDSTCMVLVNAIYFKGLWRTPFDKTRKEPFWVTPENSVDIPMMTVEGYFKTSSQPELDASLLAMDYKGGQMSMVILLPNEKNGLASLEEKLISVDLETLDKTATSSKVLLTIPKFKLEETLQLVPVLTSMGLSDLFTSKADLSGISAAKDLYVSDVIHKAFLEVNEKGTEAAAATGMTLTGCSRPQRPTPFVVNHPFLFFIRDSISRAILFAGRFLIPKEA